MNIMMRKGCGRPLRSDSQSSRVLAWLHLGTYRYPLTPTNDQIRSLSHSVPCFVSYDIHLWPRPCRYRRRWGPETTLVRPSLLDQRRLPPRPFSLSRPQVRLISHQHGTLRYLQFQSLYVRDETCHITGRLSHFSFHFSTPIRFRHPCVRPRPLPRSSFNPA